MVVFYSDNDVTNSHDYAESEVGSVSSIPVAVGGYEDFDDASSPVDSSPRFGKYDVNTEIKIERFVSWFSNLYCSQPCV